MAAQAEPVTLKELSATTGLHASTAHRMLNMLVVGRYVERVDSSAVPTGHAPAGAGLTLVKGRLNVREAALPAMRSLHRQTGQTINLSVQQRRRDRLHRPRLGERSRHAGGARAIGRRAPPSTSAASCSCRPPTPSRCAPYAQRTERGRPHRQQPHRLRRLDRELALVRRHGYARNNEELGWACAAHRGGHQRRHRQAGGRPGRSRPRPNACATNGSPC